MAHVYWEELVVCAVSVYLLLLSEATTALFPGPGVYGSFGV